MLSVPLWYPGKRTARRRGETNIFSPAFSEDGSSFL